ncbi:MAG: hypothetical protein D6696_00535, partial [Acidobacteria bacterium]
LGLPGISATDRRRLAARFEEALAAARAVLPRLLAEAARRRTAGDPPPAAGPRPQSREIARP